MKLILWGAGGHGKVVLDVARATGAYTDIAFADDDPAVGRQFAGCPVLRRPVEGYKQFLVSIGDNRTRAACYGKAVADGLGPATLIDPSAVISPTARIGSGTVVMPRVVVNADAEVGENCILNTGAIVEHDCKIGDHSHISPGAVLGGGVWVGRFAHLGIGVNVLPGAVIGDGATIGAGAVVLAEIPAGATAVGVPAKVLVRRVD